MKKLLALNSLTRDESVDLFSKLESLPIEQQSAILSLLRAKKETEDEILGAIDYFQNYSSFIDYDDNVVDIVGTGGDCTGTFNISTAAFTTGWFLIFGATALLFNIFNAVS